MPVHQAPQGVSPAASLKAIVDGAEKAGEAVVEIREIGNDWIVVTTPARRAPQHKTRVETR